MTPTAARRTAAAALLGLSLAVAGCSSDSSTDTTSSTAAGSGAASVSAALCSSFASLKTDAADLVATKVDTSGTPEQVQQQVDELAGKADKVRDDLDTMMRESQGGPEAAIIGALNQKSDALRAQLTQAKANAQEQLGPQITAAQDDIEAALAPVTAAFDKVCPSS